MYTLYDLLGAHPDDAPERLKKIYRDAIRANHPDLNPNDPQAQLRSRQILGAYAILGDAHKRAAYDRLIDIEFKNLSASSRRAILAQTIGKIASDIIAVGVVAGVLLGGYALFRHVAGPPNDIATTVQPGLPAAPPNRSEPHDANPPAPPARGDSRQRTNESQAQPGGDKQAGHTADPAEGIAAIATAAPPDSPAPQRPKPGAELLAFAPVGPAVMPAPTGAKPARVAPDARDRARRDPADLGRRPSRSSRRAEFFRQKGLAAFRSGDLTQALVDLNRAVRLDPGSRDAHADRAMVLKRMKKSERVAADRDPAKRAGRPLSLRPAGQPRPASRKTAGD